MSDAQSIESEQELRRLVRSQSMLLAVGNRTKPPLSRVPQASIVSLAGLSGILQYEPSEFTFTARAGTRVSEIIAALCEHGQYLPFDPLLVDDGSTLGGTVASGLSGPGRLRYGGLRDFILGARFVTGDGEVVSTGGKVVKNAAGFDFPKLLVGSLGRLGVMTELTFKIFPAPVARCTLRVACESVAQAVERIGYATRSRWEPDAIDYVPHEQAIYLRLAGPQPAIEALEREISAQWSGDTCQLADEAAAKFWDRVGRLFDPASQATVIKVPMSLSQFRCLVDAVAVIADLQIQLSAGGAVTWIVVTGVRAVAQLDAVLRERKLTGLAVLGPAEPFDPIGHPCLGNWSVTQISQSIRGALDPAGRFPSFKSNRLSVDAIEDAHA